MLFNILEVLFIISIPVIVQKLEKRFSIIRTLSPVLVCYAIGIFLGNQTLYKFDGEIAMQISTLSVVLAIPLLLFSTDIIGWLRLAKSTVISFSLCVFSGLVVAVSVSYLFKDSLDNSEKLAGMLVGVYTGGTPNMAAIGKATGVDPETFVNLNSADMVVSAIYLVLLLTVLPRLWSKFLPEFPGIKKRFDDTDSLLIKAKPTFWNLVVSTCLGLLVVSVSVGLSFLLPKEFQEAFAIMLITTIAISLSLKVRIRSLPGTSESGYFFLNLFCVAIGVSANFAELFDSSLLILAITAAVMVGSILLHLILSIFFKIDRDTVIITSAAAIFGPALVPPVAMALKNKDALVSGLASGLVGYAVGNYLGILVVWIGS